MNISVSIGVGPTKVIAKTASKWKKPHGTTLIPMESIHESLSQIPIGDIWGIGYKTAEKLKFMEYDTAGKFAACSEKNLFEFAEKPLIEIWNELNGVMMFPINLEHKAQKSIMKTLSFIPHKTDRDELFSELVRNVENACIKARRHGLMAYRVSWFLKTKERRYQSNEFILDTPTYSPSVIIKHLKEQFDVTNTKGRAYRSTGINLTRLIHKENLQEDMFGIHDSVRNNEDVFKTIDSISKKYGRHTLFIASGMKAHRSDDKAYRSLTLSWFKNSPLLEIIQQAQRLGFKLIITTDHGTINVKNPSKVIGDKNTSLNLRYKTGKSLTYEEKEVYAVKDPKKIGLPAINMSSSFIFAKNDDFLAYVNNFNHYVSYYRNTYQHGGVSLEEMIVPFLVFNPK